VQDSLKNTEWVTYYDPKPSNFDQAEKVVLIGRYEDEGFVANEIVTKCPSKYEAEEPKLE
jgi:cytochrome c-type biogenesis protein CcmE